MAIEFRKRDPSPDPVLGCGVDATCTCEHQLDHDVMFARLRRVEVLGDADRTNDLDVDAEFLEGLPSGGIRRRLIDFDLASGKLPDAAADRALRTPGGKDFRPAIRIVPHDGRDGDPDRIRLRLDGVKVLS